MTRHLELKGLERVPFHEYMKNTNSKPGFEAVQFFNAAIGSEAKFGVSASVSFGARAGVVDNILGMGFGDYAKLGRVELLV